MAKQGNAEPGSAAQKMAKECGNERQFGRLSGSEYNRCMCDDGDEVKEGC